MVCDHKSIGMAVVKLYANCFRQFSGVQASKVVSLDLISRTRGQLSVHADLTM